MRVYTQKIKGQRVYAQLKSRSFDQKLIIDSVDFQVSDQTYRYSKGNMIAKDIMVNMLT